MPSYGPSPLVDGVELSSQAAKLINVSITRPRCQLAIVANIEYLTSRLHPRSVLMRVIREAKGRGTVVDSQQVMTDYLCRDFERWSTMLNPRDDGIDPNDGSLYTERNFYSAFFADLRSAASEVIVVSPYLTASRAQAFFDLFQSKIAGGVSIRVFTKPMREQAGNMYRQAEMVLQKLRELKAEVIERPALHQKFAFIDRQ